MLNYPDSEFRRRFRGVLLFEEPMNRHTSLKVGGRADIFAIPADDKDLLQLVNRLQIDGTPWITIGRGYNLLVKDGGIRGVVISLERFDKIDFVAGTMVRAEAGAENLEVVRFAQKRGLGGIGFLSGIPGTIGGAVRMNAGAYGQGILEHTHSLHILRNGEMAEIRTTEIDFGYRYLSLEPADILLAATFNLRARAPHLTEEEIRSDTELRRSKHNVGHPSAGSFFKNPPGEAAWRLVDAAGMRGAKVGGAEVSPQHSNFLVNSGGATAADFLQLAALVKEAVFSTTGVMLTEEVRIVGED